MHPVLSFVEHPGARAAEDLIGHFHLGNAEPFSDLGPDGRLPTFADEGSRLPIMSWANGSVSNDILCGGTG